MHSKLSTYDFLKLLIMDLNVYLTSISGYRREKDSLLLVHLTPLS